MSDMDSQLVPCTPTTRALTFDQSQPPALNASSLHGNVALVGNTPAQFNLTTPEPVVGSSWMSAEHVASQHQEMPSACGFPAFNQSLRQVQTSPGPLNALTSMVNDFFRETPVAGRRPAGQSGSVSHPTYTFSAEHVVGLVGSMVYGSQTDTPFQRDELLEASQHLRRLLAGNKQQLKIMIPEPFPRPLEEVAAAFEILSGWGLFRVNSADATGTAVDIDVRQEKLHRLRQTISERVIIGIHRKQLSISSPANLQQQQFVEIVARVYQGEKAQELAQLNATVPPPNAGWLRFSHRSTRAMRDHTDPNTSRAQITLNVQCGELVALTYAMLLRPRPNPVNPEQLLMITFNWQQDNHSVLLYAISPDCQFHELGGDSGNLRAEIPVAQFLGWLFDYRQHLLILNPGSEDNVMGMPVRSVAHNYLETNKCITVSTCQSVAEVTKTITELLVSSGVRLETVTVSIDHPLAEVHQSALEGSSDDTDSDHDSDDSDDPSDDMAMASEAWS
ncbi:hypothetical protein [Erwinia sp. V71]|uniref:hypothetical protein n=1 Tax=Erwinia sp. V71 TaxID=3369424 RepID=UPI003F5DEDD6